MAKLEEVQLPNVRNDINRLRNDNMKPTASEHRVKIQPSWEQVQPRFCQLYVDKDMTLAEVIRTFKRKGFDKSRRQWERQTARWGIRKYQRRQDTDKALQKSGIDLQNLSAEAIESSRALAGAEHRNIRRIARYKIKQSHGTRSKLHDSRSTQPSKRSERMSSSREFDARNTEPGAHAELPDVTLWKGSNALLDSASQQRFLELEVDLLSETDRHPQIEQHRSSRRAFYNILDNIRRKCDSQQWLLFNENRHEYQQQINPAVIHSYNEHLLSPYLSATLGLNMDVRSYFLTVSIHLDAMDAISFFLTGGANASGICACGNTLLRDACIYSPRSRSTPPKWGADPLQRCPFGLNVIALACALGDSQAMYDIVNTCKNRARRHEGLSHQLDEAAEESLLAFAIYQRDVTLVKLLLELGWGANTPFADDSFANGRSPLELAATVGNANIRYILIRYGATEKLSQSLRRKTAPAAPGYAPLSKSVRVHCLQTLMNLTE